MTHSTQTHEESDAPLTVAERLILRGAAHELKPTVMVGNSGITPAVIAETLRALEAHQLIKIKMLSDDRQERATAFETLCTQTGAHKVQTIGKICVLFKDDGTYVPPTLKQETKTKKGPHIPKKKLAHL